MCTWLWSASLLSRIGLEQQSRGGMRTCALLPHIAHCLTVRGACGGGRSFDLVLATGDMLDMGTKDQDDPISVSKAEGELGTLLARLETVVSRVLYIPGNVRGLRLPHLDRSCSAHRGAVAHSMIPSRRCI